MGCKSYTALVVFGFLLAVQCRAAHRIGTEAQLPARSSQQFYMLWGNRPDDGSVQGWNPPEFNWTYNENPYQSWSDTAPRTYRFQLSTNNWSTLYWDIVTSNNFHNTVWPITNSLGQTWTGSNYWRIIYMNATASATNATGSVHHFSFSASPTNWDRSILSSDASYMDALMTPRPHMMFALTNRDAVATYFRATGQWLTTSNNAVSTIAESWWNNSNTFVALGYSGRVKIQQVFWTALVYQLSTNSYIAANAPEDMLTIYCSQYVNQGWDRYSAYDFGANLPKYLACSVDWLWDLMDTNQQAICMNAVLQTVRYYIYEGSWFSESPADTNRVYTYADRVAGGAGTPKIGNSHSRYNTGAGLFLVMSGWTNSAELRSLWQFFINPTIVAKDYPRGQEGRAYNLNSFDTVHDWSGWFLVNSAFPESHLERASDLQHTLDLYAYSEPTGYRGLHEPWGDLGYGLGWLGVQRIYPFWNTMSNLSQIISSGPGMRQYLRNPPHDGYWEFEWFIPYYFASPAQTDWPDKDYINDLWGYAVSSSHQPNDYGAFTNAVAVMTMARPASRGEHDAGCDGSFQMWAYGAHVTASGIGQYREHAIYSCGQTFIDGIGTRTEYLKFTRPIYARFLASTSSTDYAYIASDTRGAYNVTNMTDPQGGAADNYPFYSYASNTVPHLSTMNRHILFPHRKYAVLYDTMSATQLSRFQWLWHYFEDTATVNTSACSFTYTATNMYNRSNVTVHVVPFIDTNLMTLTNLTLTTNTVVITGAKYNATNEYDIDGRYMWDGSAYSTNSKRYGIFRDGSLWKITNLSATVLYTNPAAAVDSYYGDYDDFDDGAIVLGQHSDYVYKNPFTSEWFGGSDRSEYQADLLEPPFSGSVWVYNSTPATNWQFGWVIYPQRWDEPAPTITRLSNGVVKVEGYTNDGSAYPGNWVAFTDTNTFDTNWAAPYTYMVDAGEIGALPDPQTSTPTFSPTCNTYASNSMTVTISSDAGANIFWKTNAGAYTAGTSVLLPALLTYTLSAYATNMGATGSATQSCDFTLTGVPVPPSTNTARGSLRTGRLTTGAMR